MPEHEVIDVTADSMTSLAVVPARPLAGLELWEPDHLRTMITREIELRAIMLEYMRGQMKRGQHYYTRKDLRREGEEAQAGDDEKPSLKKEGALNLCHLLHCRPVIAHRDETFHPDGHYTVTTTVHLISLRTGEIVGEGEGLCSTRESKYAWRWLWPSQLPDDQRVGLVTKSIKPRKGRDAGQWVTMYRIPNRDLADQYNTVLKLSYKRGLVAGVLTLPLGSELFTQDLEPEDGADDADAETEGGVGFNKLQWQREHRQQFQDEHGYSEKADYATGKLRQSVLERDHYACVMCGMTDADHKLKWGRPITVDHIDRDKTHNTLDNLQTLCLTCHGRKDQLPELREEQVPQYRDQILKARQQGQTYQAIADALGFSSRSIWKWCQRWTPGASVGEPMWTTEQVQHMGSSEANKALGQRLRYLAPESREDRESYIRLAFGEAAGTWGEAENLGLSVRKAALLKLVALKKEAPPPVDETGDVPLDDVPLGEEAEAHLEDIRHEVETSTLHTENVPPRWEEAFNGLLPMTRVTQLRAWATDLGHLAELETVLAQCQGYKVAPQVSEAVMNEAIAEVSMAYETRLAAQEHPHEVEEDVP